MAIKTLSINKIKYLPKIINKVSFTTRPVPNFAPKQKETKNIVP